MRHLGRRCPLDPLPGRSCLRLQNPSRRLNSPKTRAKKFFLWITRKTSPFVSGATHPGSRAASGAARQAPAPPPKITRSPQATEGEASHVLHSALPRPTPSSEHLRTPAVPNSRSPRTPNRHPPADHTPQIAPTTTTQSSNPPDRCFHSPGRRRATHSKRVSTQRQGIDTDNSYAQTTRARTHGHATPCARLTTSHHTTPPRRTCLRVIPAPASASCTARFVHHPATADSVKHHSPTTARGRHPTQPPRRPSSQSP